MMKTFTTKLLNTLILVSVLFGLSSSEALAQVTFPSYSPTAASSVAVCSGEETLIIDFTVAQAASNGIEVKVKLADGIEYVSGSAVITATQGNAVAVAQTNIANLNEPVFTVTSADGNNEVEVGTIVKLTIKRRAVCTAWNNAITAAETGFVFKDKVTVTIDGHSDSKESNTYSVSYPNLTINQPAPQSNKQIGETITREFTITNGSQNPTGTVYLSIEYPDEAYLTGTGAMTLQARLGTSGAYVDLTPTATNGKVRSYTLSGTLLGSDALLTNGEIIYLKETFKLKTCAPLTTYRLGWGCSTDQQCEIKTTTAVITMEAGVANITDYTVTGPNYNDASFSTCNPFELTFTCKNTGTGGTMGAAYDLKLIGKTDYHRPRKFTMHQFVEIETLTGTIVPNNITDGMELDLRFEDKFNFDPDGPGVGLDDIDGDGYYDDLPVGATLTLKYKVKLNCDAFTECSNKKEISDRGLITKVLHRTACDKASWVEPAVYHTTSSAHMFLTREKVVDASYIPINIEKNKPFDMKIMTTYYSIVSSYNRKGANANPNSRYVIEIDIPAGLTMPADADIKWTKISSEETIDGAVVYGTPTTLPAGNITRTSDKITIVSPDNKIGFVTLHGVKFDCTNNSTMSVSYRFYEVFNYLNYPTCICPSVPLMCGTFTRNVLGCAPPCSNGPQTGIPVVEREDNSLGWTDYTMTARQSRNNISSYDLAKAIYMDEIRLTASAVQHGPASSLGARFVLKLGRSNTRTLEPLSADITITRNGVQIVSVTGHTVSLSKHASENQQIDWDFTSILPAQGLLDGDKIDVITRYKVHTEYGYYVDTQMGREWFLYNSDTNTVPIWNTANPITCIRLVPEIYVMSTYAINGTNPHTISGCSSIDIGGVSNNYARRFQSGALPYTNEYRPGVKIKNVYIKIPKSYTLNKVTFRNHRNHPSPSGNTPFIELSQETVTTHGEYNIYKYPFPADHTSHFNITVENVYGAILLANITPTCASSDIVDAYDKMYYYLDYIDYYYYASAQPSIPSNLNIEAPLPGDDNSPTYSAYRPLIYSNKPSVTLVNQSGEVEMVGKTGEWKLRINNPSTSTAPYVWLALPNTGGLTINEVTSSSGDVVAFTTYSGGKMYRLSEAGVAAGTALDYTIKFTYSGCSPTSLKAMGGWNCSAFPSAPVDYVCNVQTVDLKLKPLPAAMELTQVKVPNPTEAATLCNTLEYIYSIQSTDNANVYSPSFSIFLEEGLVVTPNQVEVQYPAGTGTWSSLNVVNNSVNLLEHPALASIGNLKGLKEAGANDNQRKILVKFFVKTGCSFVSGKNFRIRADGRNACNQNAKGSGLAVSTPPIRIDGAIEPYTTSAATQVVTTTTSQSDCKAPKRVKVVQTIVGGTTTSKAYLEITLPLGFKYVTGSYAPDNTHPGGANALPAGSEVVTVTANGEDKIRINIKAGLTTGQSFAYTIDMKEDDNNAPACGNHTIEIVNVEEIEGLWCEGVQCTATFVTTGVSKFDFALEKPNLILTIGTATSVPTGGKENISVEYTVTNTSPLSLNAGTIVTLFSDKDGNNIYSAGDVIVGTQAIPTEVLNGTPFSQTMKVNGVLPTNTEHLFLTILAKDGCFCEVNTPNVVLEKLPANYWIGGTAGKPNEWAEPNNWTNNHVPNATEDVEFATEINNPIVSGNPKSGPAKEDLHLDNILQNSTEGRIIGNLINDSDKDLVITTGNQLIINGQVLDNNPNAGTIVVKSSKDAPTGTLLFADPANNPNVGATVEFYNQGYDCADCGMYRRSWQYFGIPLKDADFPYNDVLGNETVNQWVESFNGDKWRPAPFAPDTNLKMFKGYEITNSSNTLPTDVYSFKGELYLGDATVDLTRTSGVNYSGSNLVGNSYTAAIDIKKALVFPAETEQTVYLFNTGTRDQWRKLDGSTVSGYRAGQYLAVPQNTAGQGNLPDRIPSMHAFMLRMLTNTNSSLGITYEKLIKNTSVDNGNGTQIVWRANGNAGASLPFLVMDVLGNESADRLWIFSHADMTFGFDNGWDGRKLKESGISQLYAMGPMGDDKFQVAAVPEINGLLVGFDAEKEGRYDLEFALSEDYAEGTVFIHDLHTDMKQRVVNGGSYSFEAKRGDTGARFRLSYVEGADDELAQIQVGTVANRIVITNNTSHDYQASVYATDGKLLQRINVPAGSEMKSDPMIAGGYVVNLQSPTTNGSAKKVVIN